MSAIDEAVEDQEAATPHAAAGTLARAGPAVWWRGAGLLGGKAIAIARTIALARLLVPADFGLFAIALLPLELLLGLTDVGMRPALVQRAEVTARDYDVAWTVGVVRGAVVGLVLAAAAPLLAAAFGDPRATVLLRALALRPVVAAAASVRVAALERELRYRALAGIELLAAVLGTALALACATQFGHWALVAASVGSAAVSTAASYAVAPYRPRLALDRRRLGVLFHFGRWVLAAGVVATAGEAVLRTTIAHTLGTDALGRYALAASLAAVPVGLAGVVVNTVAFAVHARLQTDDREAGRTYRASILALTALLLPTYAAIAVAAPALVTHLLGAAWQGTAPVIQVLAVVGLLGVAFDATVPLLRGRGRARAAAGLQVGFVATTLALVWPLTRAAGLVGAALARVPAEVVVCVGCLWLARRTLDRPFRGLARPLGAVIIAGLVAACAVAACVRLLPGASGPIVGGLAALAVAAVALWLLDRWLRLGLFETVRAAVRGLLRGRTTDGAHPAAE